jgi:hypothetical protein
VRKSFSQASWEYAPSTPWQATMADVREELRRVCQCRADPFPDGRSAVRELMLQRTAQIKQRGEKRIGSRCKLTADLRGQHRQLFAFPLRSGNRKPLLCLIAADLPDYVHSPDEQRRQLPVDLIDFSAKFL